MLKRLFIAVFCLCLFAACTPRSVPTSSSEKESSIAEASSPTSAVDAKPLTPADFSSAPSQPLEEDEEEMPAPTLTDMEKELLKLNLDLFVHFIGGNEIASASNLSPKIILLACLAEIENTKDLNAYFFPTNDAGKDLIPADLMAEKALQLFGIEKFTATSDSSYVSDKESYISSEVAIPKSKASDPIGAPDDHISYTVTIDGADYVYTGKIFRQNGMPYLRFASAKEVLSK